MLSKRIGVEVKLVAKPVGNAHGLRNEIHNKQVIEHEWLPQAVLSCFIRLFAATFAWLQANEVTTCQSQAQSQFTGKSILLRNPWGSLLPRECLGNRITRACGPSFSLC